VTRRWRRRLVEHHLPLALLTAIVLSVVSNLWFAVPATQRLSIATAYLAYGLFAATLLLGPLNLARARRNPVSIDLRRDMGCWSAAAAFVHVALSLQNHFNGNWVVYFAVFDEERETWGPRLDSFGVANLLGLGATALLALLLATSADWALAALRPRLWKWLQRSAYVAFGLSLLHGLAFQLIAKREAWALAATGLIAAVVLAAQLAGAAVVQVRAARPTQGAG
jgi:DMSO/TMAO reductase YedYZ heme-binding membrane subunit